MHIFQGILHNKNNLKYIGKVMVILIIWMNFINLNKYTVAIQYTYRSWLTDWLDLNKNNKYQLNKLII